jgi:quercetin dioxygenase-like cupin family protein
MKNAFAVLVAVCGLSSVAVAQDKMAKSHAVLTPAADIKWTDVPNAPGVQISVVEGDAAKGAHHFYLKFAPGFAVGAHHHSADHYATIVSGTLVLTVDGKETKLPGGSYVQLTNKTKHATKCEAGADCIMFIHSKGKWDAVMEDAKPTAKK